jgi:penicillin amidase
MRKFFVRTFKVFFVIYLIFFGVGAYIYFQSRPTLEGKMSLKGLQGKVTITRDQYGVPHIAAEKSDLDAFFALGYVHAQDRFWQMEFNRRVAQGTLSEVLGEQTLTADKYLRTWGFYKAAEKAWPALSPQTQAILQSYTDGVNAYIAEKHFPLQFSLLRYEPKPWTVMDSISWQKMMAWNLQTSWKSKVKNYIVEKNVGKNQISILFPSYPDNGPLVLSDLDLKQSGLLGKSLTFNTFANAPEKGSNAWVISGKLTESGKPILADDPHLELQSPSTWYLAELKGPNLHIEGATIPGLPTVVIGHNDHIAWGVTNVNPDVQDLYILNPTSPIKKINEIIKVKNKPDVNFTVRESDVGPIISDVTEAGQINPQVALKWTALDPNDTTVQSMLEIDYAKNWNEFVGALKDFVVPSQNFVYADRAGNIGYYLSGKIPVRNWDTNLPVLDDKQHQWKNYIPFEKLPHVYNPTEGYIVTANNRVVSNNYPYAINFRWSVPPYRAERIIELLKEDRPLDIEKNEQIQNDTVSLLWKSLSLILLDTKALDSNSKIALNYLKNWDGSSSLDSISQTIFAYWYRELGSMTPSFISTLMSLPEPLYIEKKIKENPDFLSQSLEAAMQKLIKDKGNDPKNWNWGNIHHAVFREVALGGVPGLNLLWNRSIPSRGSLYTVNAGSYDENNFNQIEGAGYRQIIDLNNFDNSVYIQSLGQSNDPLTSHYQDLMTFWRDGKYLSMSSHEDAWGDVKILTLNP